MVFPLILIMSMFFAPLAPTDFEFVDQFVREKYVPDRLLIKFKEGIPTVQTNTILRDNDADNVLSEIEAIKVKIIRVPEEKLERIQNELARNPNVEYVEKDFLFEPTKIPNDPQYQNQWHLDKIQASKAWDIHQGSSSIPIAILDSGVDPAHSDLQGKLMLGYNFNNDNNDWSDTCGHGTKVAGVASAITNNGVGVAGVTWDNPIIPIRITTDNCLGVYSSMIKGIVYAADNGARAANLSFRIFDGASLKDAAKYMYDKGGWVVASAGNTGLFENYPDNPYIISVGATDSSDSITSFSSYGPYVDFSAPGSSIVTTALGNSYISGSGTSFSSPIVAGLVALIVSNNPSLSSAQVYDTLKDSAIDLGSSGYDHHYGWGRVDAFQAIHWGLFNLHTEPLSVTITDPLNSTVVSGTFSVSVETPDNESVSRVELYFDDQFYGQKTSQPYDFTLDATTMTEGSHELKAIAYDSNGNSAFDQITVIVENNKIDAEAPSVSIITPTDGATVEGEFNIITLVSDSSGIMAVKFYIDGELKRTIYDKSNTNNEIAQPPSIKFYGYWWYTSGQPSSSHTITVEVFDVNENMASDSVIVQFA